MFSTSLNFTSSQSTREGREMKNFQPLLGN
nr:MAG TPA: hypothetical protein [Caudoviricetes sp.]